MTKSHTKYDMLAGSSIMGLIQWGRAESGRRDRLIRFVLRIGWFEIIEIILERLIRGARSTKLPNEANETNGTASGIDTALCVANAA